jgi:type I restriction enzyme R subunit
LDFSGLKAKTRELRAQQTEAEALLWELLRNRKLAGAKFRRQHRFGKYITSTLLKKFLRWPGFSVV